MRILVVDDEPDVIESVRLGFQLQWREVEVIGARGADEALAAVESETPDIVLLDIGLPDRDGFAVLRELREFSDVPVVMLTARDDAMDKVKGLELGADDYVTKPFNHLELMARVRAVLRRHDMPAPASRSGRPATTANRATPWPCRTRSPARSPVLSRSRPRPALPQPAPPTPSPTTST